MGIIQEVQGNSSQCTISYDRALLGSVLTVENVNLNHGIKPFSVKIAIDPKYTIEQRQNLVGVLGKVRRTRYVKNALDAINANYGQNRANITSFVLTGVQMSPDFVDNLPSLWSSAVSQANDSVSKYLQKDSLRSKFVSAMMGLQRVDQTGMTARIVI